MLIGCLHSLRLLIVILTGDWSGQVEEAGLYERVSELICAAFRCHWTDMVMCRSSFPQWERNNQNQEGGRVNCTLV